MIFEDKIFQSILINLHYNKHNENHIHYNILSVEYREHGICDSFTKKLKKKIHRISVREIQMQCIFKNITLFQTHSEIHVHS